MSHSPRELPESLSDSPGVWSKRPLELHQFPDQCVSGSRETVGRFDCLFVELPHTRKWSWSCGEAGSQNRYISCRVYTRYVHTHTEGIKVACVVSFFSNLTTKLVAPRTMPRTSRTSLQVSQKGSCLLARKSVNFLIWIGKYLENSAFICLLLLKQWNQVCFFYGGRRSSSRCWSQSRILPENLDWVLTQWHCTTVTTTKLHHTQWGWFKSMLQSDAEMQTPPLCSRFASKDFFKVKPGWFNNSQARNDAGLSSWDEVSW